MKKSTSLSLLTMLLLFIGSNVWADTYSHTFVTTDIPENTTDTQFTLSDVDWTLVMDGGKVSVFSNDLGAHFGTNNSTCNSVTLSTEGITGTITSVAVEASRGKNLIGTMEVKVGGANFALGDGTTTGLTQENAAYEFTGSAEGEIAIVWTKSEEGGTNNKGAFYIKKITIEYEGGGGGGVTVTKPVITPNGGTFYNPQEVSIISEGNTIYYTLDGTDPTEASTLYEAPFTVSESCTVKAIAYDPDDNASNVASATFVIKTLETYATIGALCAAASGTEEDVIVEFNEWICTGATGNNVYFTDGANGILLYQNNHGFKVGDKLTGTAKVKLVLFNDCAEIKGLTATTEGVTIESGATATPQKVVVADLDKNMQGCLITLEGVTYSGGVFVDDDDNTITPYNKFNITMLELLEGKTYNVTGVAIWYKNSGIWEIAPRTTDEFELVTDKQTPVSSWSVEEEVVDVNETPTAVFTTTSDGTVTYNSSNEGVATIDENGIITPVAKGVTVITANVAESDSFLPDSKSFTLTVTEDGYADAIFAYDDADIVGQGASETGAELSASRNNGVLTLYANKAYAKPNDTHIKIYGSKFEGEDENKVLTEPSYIKLTVPEGYAITKIVLTATGEDNIKTWKDQFDTAAIIDGATATWEGMQEEVILTNQATSQARIKTICVTYADPVAVGIKTVNVQDSMNNVIYNLAGQRLSKMQKGINIVGGKKILK